jgi:hypothetical protein
MKVALDSREGKCFILGSEEVLVDRMGHLTVIVNRGELTSFFRPDECMSYEGRAFHWSFGAMKMSCSSCFIKQN